MLGIVTAAHMEDAIRIYGLKGEAEAASPDLSSRREPSTYRKAHGHYRFT